MNEPADKRMRSRALDPAQSFIVQAPAGSGKTDLLTKRYLRLLATVEHPEQVLAITFTRKAAAEMRNRIISALAQVDNATDTASPSPHEVQLYELARAVRQQDSAQNWQLAGHPARLKIQTIDSLNTELTRQLPLLAKFGSQPQITEQQTTLYEEAAYRTLLMLEEDNPAIAAQIEILLHHLDNDWARLRGLLVVMLTRRDQWLPQLGTSTNSPDRQALEKALARAVEHQLTLLCQSLPNELTGEIAALAAYAARRLHEANANSAGQSQPAILACANLTALPTAIAQALPVWRGVAELLLTQNGGWRKRFTKNEGFPTDGRQEKQRIENVLKQLRESDNASGNKEDARFRHYLHSVRILPEPVYNDPQWQVLDALLTVLPLAVAQLQVVFGERGEVDFTENALRAREALSDNDEAGTSKPTDLALRLDNSIQHILVDEFQDTSLSQYRLLESLVAGWQAGDGRTLFVVGDPMQSIYRFREAEVGLYLDARTHGIGDVTLTPLTLTANFRSRPSVVNWVNNTFSEVLPGNEDTASGAVPYSAADAQRDKTTETGVTIHPQLALDPDAEAEQVLDVLEKTRRANPQARIAILVRGRPHLAAILPGLRANGWRYQAVELERLGSQSVVQDLLALTRALLHPGDRTAWLAVLRAPWCGLTLADLHIIATDESTAPGIALVPTVLENEAAIKQLSESGQVRVQKIWPILSDALHNRRRRNLRDTIEAAWLAVGGPATLVNRVELDDAMAFFDILES
ncbi:MAG TPA: UvrD-helicase domain-containing protein, partial [Gammaproteobacteria bacterium]|nr:UvrD-helicase domain-containing protein [Gammaproteobacteria bacterium]